MIKLSKFRIDLVEGQKNTLFTIIVLILFISSGITLLNQNEPKGEGVISQENPRANIPENNGDYPMNRASNLDIGIYHYGIEEDIDYYSVDLNYTFFCMIQNNDHVQQANGIWANVSVEFGGEILFEDGIAVNNLKPYNGEEGNIKKVIFEQFLPESEGTYKILFSIQFNSNQTVDPYNGDNQITWYVNIEDRTSVKVIDLNLNPDKTTFTVNSKLFIHGTIENQGLTPVTFTAIFNVSYEDGYLPLIESKKKYSLTPKGTDGSQVVLEYNYTFEKVANHTIYLEAYHRENENNDYYNSLDVRILRINPPEPDIVKPVSNIPFGPSSPTYFSDELIRLDGSNSTYDNRTGEINFLWSSDLEGTISTNMMDSIYLEIEGIHLITLTVDDGFYQRSTSVLIEVVQRGQINLEDGVISISAQYTSQDEVTTDISIITDPYVNKPQNAELDIYRKITMTGNGLELHWINITIDYKDSITTSGEEVTDEQTITLYQFNEKESKWDAIPHQGLDLKHDEVWGHIEKPSATVKIGVFSDTKLTVARLKGKVFGYDEATNIMNPLPNTKVTVDRYNQAYTDDNGEFQVSEYGSHTFSIDISKKGYQSISYKQKVTKGQTVSLTFLLQIKMGGINGSVVEYNNEKNRLSNVTVNLAPISGRVDVQLEEKYTTITDMNGNFSFAGIPIGQYKVIVKPKGVLVENQEEFVAIQENVFIHTGNLTLAKINRQPIIKDGEISSTEGMIGDEFIITVIYRDPDNERPSWKKVSIQPVNIDLEMDRKDYSSSYLDGVVYEGRWTASEAGTIVFSFFFTDARGEKAQTIEDIEIIIKKPRENDDGGPSIWTYILIGLGIVILLLLAVFIFMRVRGEQYYCPECGAKVDPEYYDCPECGEELPDFFEEDFGEYSDEVGEKRGGRGEQGDEYDSGDTDYDNYSSLGR